MINHFPGAASASGPILVAVDGTAEAEAAFDLGLELAEARKAPVTALHVAPVASRRLFEADSMRPAPTDRVLATDPVLSRLAQRAGRRGVAVHYQVSGGSGSAISDDAPDPASVAPAILGVADALEAQLIVMGSRGRRGLARAWGGSTSEAVQSEARRPVLVVRG